MFKNFFFLQDDFFWGVQMNFDQIFIKLFGLLLTSSLGEFNKTTKIHVWWVGSSIHDCSSSFSIPFFYAPSILALIPQFSLLFLNSRSHSLISLRFMLSFHLPSSQEKKCASRLERKSEVAENVVMEINGVKKNCKPKRRSRVRWRLMI